MRHTRSSLEPARDAHGETCGDRAAIEDLKLSECLLAGEKLVLEMVARGRPLPATLDALCRVVEQLCDGSLCGILLVDATGRRVEHIAAPSLPLAYNNAIQGRPVDSQAGPCGQAAYLNEQVIVSDVASDTGWDAHGWRTLALSHGLRACWSTPIRSSSGSVLGTFAIYWREPRRPTEQSRRVIEQVTDLAAVAIERKRTETAPRDSEERFRLIVDSIPGLVCTTTPTGEIELVNRQVIEYTGKTRDELAAWATSDVVHPDDLPLVIAAWNRALETAEDYYVQHRMRRADGVYRWFDVHGLPLRDDHGRVLRWHVLLHDVDDRKKAEERLREEEKELRAIVDAIPQSIAVLSPEGRTLYVNRYALEFTGLTLEEVLSEQFRTRAFHPEDVERLNDGRRRGLGGNKPFELEQRALRKDGQYRWCLTRYNPVCDAQGRVLRWYATGTDIEERKQAEEKIRNENLALREEIDRSSMFEEIVGASDGLRRVLAQVAKVAATDSTVLILGETGTGKELIARAIHKRSARANHAFIRINCAAIPPSLVTSELFGHEKGAFTGALQRRLGRFESANGGTIFLDEIGDLPIETQIALLRVLQEREIERIGSSRSIPVDVRVLAATHRDLEGAVQAGAFRRDLFYRLNVFPIQIPPLRDRQDDIPLLVQYLIERYATKAGKRIRNINRTTLEAFRAYEWPGNVRELQNVIERSVILCDGDTFAVDEAWLKRGASQRPGPVVSMTRTLADRERDMIEAALTASKGRIAGPDGAAARLGIPRQTLDSKIRLLGIDKQRFRTG
jgi:formate hydrogenlyase transcriptional activator